MNVIGLESGTVGFDQKSADLIVLIFDLGPDHGDVGDGARGDPHLLAVQHIFVANFAGAGAHAAGIRSEVGLGQSEAAKLFAFLHRGQPVVFLLVRAEGVNRIHHQRRLHADEGAHAGISAFEFLRDQPVFDVRHAGAAIAVQRCAEESQIGHRLHQFARKAAGAVALLDDRDEIVFDELARRVAHEALVIVEQGVEVDEIHTAEFDGWHYLSPHRSMEMDSDGKLFKVAERQGSQQCGGGSEGTSAILSFNGGVAR